MMYTSLGVSILYLPWPWDNLRVYSIPREPFLLLSHLCSFILSTIHSTNTLCQRVTAQNFPNTNPWGVQHCLLRPLRRGVGALSVSSIRCLRLSPPPSSLTTWKSCLFFLVRCPKALYSPKAFVTFHFVFKVLLSDVCVCIYSHVTCICMNGPEFWSVSVFPVSNQIAHFRESSIWFISSSSQHH